MGGSTSDMGSCDDDNGERVHRDSCNRNRVFTQVNTTVVFAGWTPDQSDLNNPGVIEAKNVIPSSTGYKSFPSLKNLTGAINARCRGSVQGESKSITYYNICGTATKLYHLLSATLLWEDVTRSGTSSSSPMAYTTDPTATTVDEAKTRWEFVLCLLGEVNSISKD